MLLETTFYVCVALAMLYLLSKNPSLPKNRKSYSRPEMLACLATSTTPPNDWTEFLTFSRATSPAPSEASGRSFQLEDEKENSVGLVAKDAFAEERKPFSVRETSYEFNPQVAEFVPQKLLNPEAPSFCPLLASN